MVKYTSNSKKRILLFLDDIEETLYPGEILEGVNFFEKNIIIETEKSYNLSKITWVGLFFGCFFLTILKIIIMESNTLWTLNVDPFYVRTVETCRINNSVSYFKSVFRKDGTLMQLPVLLIDEKEVNINIFVDYFHIKRKFLMYSFELCWLTMISEFLISLVFIFADKYNLLLLIVYIVLSIAVVIPAIFKILKSYKQYVSILNNLKQMGYLF